VFRFVLLRLLASLPVLFGVTLLTFAMLWLAPGDPLTALTGAELRGAPAEEVAELRRSYGLDRPLPQQYLAYLGGLVTGDLGRSLRSGRPVAAEFGERFPATVQLGLAALVIAIALGLGTGLLAAAFPRSWVDRLGSGLVLLGISVPVFWSGLLLMLLFSLRLGWLPASGSGSWRHLLLPALALGFATSAQLSRIARSSLREALVQPHVHTARAKGLTRTAVLFRHGLRNALLPIVTILGLQLGQLLGGAVLTEAVFAWPGVGRMLVDAIVARDLPLIQGSTLVLALLFVLINLLVDAGYAALDPRIRYS
jgi:ABC-type dipeptide/oligopeptide/nickel transport system permease component